MAEILVLGAGVMGSPFSVLLADCGHKIIVANQGRYDIPINTVCRLKVDVEKVHFFDQVSQKRINIQSVPPETIT